LLDPAEDAVTTRSSDLEVLKMVASSEEASIIDDVNDVALVEVEVRFQLAAGQWGARLAEALIRGAAHHRDVPIDVWLPRRRKGVEAADGRSSNDAHAATTTISRRGDMPLLCELGPDH
jgi:hypothetical protein